MDTNEEIRRGAEAARVLESEVYKEAIGKVREDIVRSMTQSPLGDAQTHNRLVIALQLLVQIEKSLRDVMNTGAMAKMQTSDTTVGQIKRFLKQA